MSSEEDEFRGFFDAHLDDIYATAKKILKDAQEAENVAQDVFISYYEHYFVTKSAEDPRAVLRAMAANKARDYFRAKSRRPELVEDAREIADASPASMEDPSEALDQETVLGKCGEDYLRILDGAFKSLRHDFQQILVLRHFDGLEYKEIAQRTGQSPETLRQWDARALDAIYSAVFSDRAGESPEDRRARVKVLLEVYRERRESGSS